jgi:hypothetical protein
MFYELFAVIQMGYNRFYAGAALRLQLTASQNSGQPAI